MLSVREISITYGENPVPAVADFSLEMKQGEIVSIVGESGSGKTSLVRAILGCLPGGGHVSQGEILFEGRALSGLGPEEWRNLRGTEISMIFQDSGAMLNPVRRIGSQYVEYIRTHERVSRKEAWEKGKEMLEQMRLPAGEHIMRSYPFQLSGGQRQRVGIAMAMTFQPKLLLADEPTSALDVTTQAQIVRQMLKLRDEYHTGIIVVTHNLGVAAYMADRIVVMKEGRIVDAGTRDQILNHPSSHYTKNLLDSVPAMGGYRFV
ncbi:ABC transporter ATP-binding protein [Lachnoclostridium sp. An138]|uniref:ABC transporter ATP-binding protein n=1 Tax=Lachnoclostridium sp. An138 TaxID=1965560 RepID=UPI000B37A60F|nr:ABC transporter ATP-binding protein [Lachnoclostridium sp. An138]OUQ20688.1 peptide ABC transporter ATP-binding protein [Lachnoclostridium sp. An138]